MKSETSDNISLNHIPEVTDWTGAVRGMFANRANPPYLEETIALFDEKERYYIKPSLRAETTYSFYDRSSLTEFAHLRRMLQRWVDRLPPDKQRDIVGRMRHRGRGSPKEEQSFNGAFFELFLNEFLNGTGGYTVVDPKIGNLTPDFGVTETGPDGNKINYIVEATDVNVALNTDLESDWKERQALDALDEIPSPDYRLWVRTEGVLTSVPPKRALQRPFEELAAKSDYDDVSAIAELYGPYQQVMPKAEFQHGGWRITGHLVPVPRERRPRKGRFIGAGPAKGGGYDPIGKTKTRLYDKAKRYKAVDNLIIALRGDWWLEREHVAQALFGRIARVFYQPAAPTGAHQTTSPHTEQLHDGFWANASGPQHENVTGVAVFHSLYPHNIDRATATFYGNPYTDKPLPAWANEITHAEYRDGKVEIVEGVLPGYFAKDHEPLTQNPFD